MKKLITLMVLLLISFEISYSVTKKAIKPSDLPAAVITDIKTRYPNSIITEAYKVNNKEIISFEVIIKIQSTQYILYYDVNGNFLRKENVKPTPPVKPIKKATH